MSLNHPHKPIETPSSKSIPKADLNRYKITKPDAELNKTNKLNITNNATSANDFSLRLSERRLSPINNT